MTSTTEFILNALVETAFDGVPTWEVCISKQELDLVKAHSQIGALERMGAVIEDITVVPTHIEDVLMVTFSVDLCSPF